MIVGRAGLAGGEGIFSIGRLGWVFGVEKKGTVWRRLLKAVTKEVCNYDRYI